MIYIDKVRKYSETMDVRSAVNRAVNECINEDILKEFLLKNKSEAIRMSIFEYDAEREMRCLRLEIQRELRDEVERVVRDEIERVVRDEIEKIIRYSGLNEEQILKLKN